MDKILLAINRGVTICVLIGIAILYFSVDLSITSFFPEVSFEEILDGKEIKKGSHIAGNIVYALSPIASKSTYKEMQNGSKTPSKVTENYYAIPMKEGLIIIKASQYMTEEIEVLVNETHDYLLGGDYPVSQVYIEGKVRNLDKKLIGYYREYMLEYGYTAEEIDSMGQPLIIDPFSKGSVRSSTVVGLVFILFGVGLAYRNYKKDSIKEQEQYTIEA